MIIKEYYQKAFYEWGRTLEHRGFSYAPSCHRETFWSTICPDVYKPAYAVGFLEQYLVHLDSTFKEILQHHSVAYWIHACRRFSPFAIGENKAKETVVWTRASLDAAIQKYGMLEVCDGIADSRTVDESAVLRGYLKANDPDGLKVLRKNAQTVLTNFGLPEYEQILELEKLAYEVWRSMAQLRTVGKGALLRVYDVEPWVYDARSDDLDFLITNFDDRGAPYATTATGTVFEPGGGGLGKGKILLPVWNADNIEFRELRGLLKALTNLDIVAPAGGPNFLWIPFNLGSYFEAHQYFGDAFRHRYGVSLESVLGIVGTLSAVMLDSSRRMPMWFFRMWQRAYEPPCAMSDLKRWLAESMPGMLPRFGIPADAALKDLDPAVDLLTLTSTNRSEIDIGYAGPSCPFLPYDKERVFIDYANLFHRLYYLFLRVEVADQNFKGAALEAITRPECSPLPCARLKANDGTSRQVDAAFAVEDVLVIAECRAVGRSIAFLRGNVAALTKRREVIDKSLKDIDDKAQWLRANPKGTNYDVSGFRYILPLGITPFVEFIHSRDSYYWIDERTPRVLTPHELEELLVEPLFAKQAKASGNIVNLGVRQASQ